MLNLDTHILVDLVHGTRSEQERQVFLADDLAISDVVLWEIAALGQLGRLTLDMNDRRFRAVLDSPRIVPIDPEVAQTSCRLDFHSDPADELIAATSIVHDLPVLARDTRIRASKPLRFAP